jgi:hypothetical protein
VFPMTVRGLTWRRRGGALPVLGGGGEQCSSHAPVVQARGLQCHPGLASLASSGGGGSSTPMDRARDMQPPRNGRLVRLQ